MNRKKRFTTILLLGLLTAIVPFSIDMYLPGFPDIAKSFGTTVTKVALSLSSFFIGIGIGQLMYGPLLDRYGRKSPLYVGLVLYCLTSLGCAFANSIEVLVALRFVQAIGACSATIAATAMVRDFFPPEENAKIFSFLILVLSVSPMLAPTAGSYVAASLGWTYIFGVLTILVVVILLGTIFFLPESKGADTSFSLRPSAIIGSYVSVLKESQFTAYALMASVSFAGLFTYIAISPAIFIEHYGLTQKQYGLLFAFLASGLIIASQINTALLKRFKSEQIIRAAFIFQVLIGILLLSIYLLGIDSMWLTIGLLFFYLSSVGLIMPNASALAMQPFEKNAGSASALLGFIQMALGSFATILIGVMNIQSVVPMIICILLGSIVGLCLVVWSTRQFLRKEALLAS